MADKLCHLCGTRYIDDPFLTRNPGHTPEQCLQILNWRVGELREKLEEAEDNLKRAKKSYKAHTK